MNPIPGHRRITSSPRAEAPAFYECVQRRARERWEQLEADPELAGPWHQLFKQVQSPRHVLSELLQNADDAGATSASARIEGNEFVFEHNGIDFEELHFASLCKFGYSNKRNLHTIGFRGIGFKSTFSLGDEVRLISPTLSVAFRRERFTEPIWLAQCERIRTTQVRVEIKDEHRRKELAKNLKEWASSPLSLLFFRNIMDLTIEDWRVRRIPMGPGPTSNSEWVTLSESQDEPFLLIRSEEESFPPEAVEEIRQERMGADDFELPPCQLELVVGGDCERRLFVVLPTGVEVQLPFACDAPFIQDPARVKIKDPEISPTNRWLLQRAGKLAASAMLAWLQRDKLSAAERSRAYIFFPDVDRDDNSLEGVCGTTCEEAFGEEIKGAQCLLTEDGSLVESEQCTNLPSELHDIWSSEQLSSLFDPKNRPLLSRHVQDEHKETLEHWGLIESVAKSSVLDTLESRHLPKPPSWRQLLALWDFVSNDVCTRGYYHSRGRKNIRIAPVQGQEVLFRSSEVVRLAEKKLLNSQEDWQFLSKYLLVLNQNWPRFLAEQRRHAEQKEDEDLAAEVESAYSVLQTLELGEASDVSQVVERVAAKFFGEDEEDCPLDDCVRLAQIAATLGATVLESFQYVTQDDCRTATDDEVLADPDGQLDLFVNEEWYEAHALHRAYWREFLSCSEDVWGQWALSERSRLLSFVPLCSAREHVWGRQKIRRILHDRGCDEEPYFHYVTDSFVINDHNFDAEHWEHWRSLAKEDPEFWGRLLARMLALPNRYWSKALSARAVQVATTGNTRAITTEELLPAWIMEFRSLPCLEDTHGRMREPAELLRRTPDTEALLDVEPFVRAEYDDEQTRPILIKLGVRDTPTGPDRLLDRLRALSRASSPPVYEIEKWYGRLDHLLTKCTTAEAGQTREAFMDERLILTDAGEWVRAREVFLNANEEDVPGAATVHLGVRHLALWNKVGVADHPTADLAMQWLKGLGSGVKLSADQMRRVRSLLPRYAVQIWEECGRWLNLEGEWAATEDLTYKLTMQSLVPWSNLFSVTKSRTADLQRLATELCDQPPFSSLRSLAASIEEHIEEGLYDSAAPRRKPWMETLGKSLRRIKVDEEGQAERIREAALRLARTVWQPAHQLEAVPYIEDTPVGTARKLDALWRGETLYIANERVARSFKAIAQELARPFDRQDIADAIKACMERSSQFIEEYMEENFVLLPADEVEELQEGATRVSDSSPTDTDDQESPAPEPESDLSAVPSPESAETGTETPTEEQADGVDEASTEPEPSEPPARPRAPRAPKSRFTELYAKAHGYQKDGEADRFYHPDGSWLQKSDGGTFPWERYAADGELLQSLWLKNHCLQEEPLQLNAAIWSLCQSNPEAYTLVLADADGHPVELTGGRLCELTQAGTLKLYPAEYRLAYEREGTG